MDKKNKWLRVALTARSRIHRINLEEHSMNPSDDISGKALRATQKILIVEDNAMNQKVITKMLEILGYPCDVADCAATAIEKLIYQQYACILLDLGLPDMDGLELLKFIKGYYTTPIITCTAYGDESRDDCIAAGAVEHIAKPIIKGKLEATLVKTLEGNNVNIHPPRK